MPEDPEFDQPWWSIKTLLKWISKGEEEGLSEIRKNESRLGLTGKRGPWYGTQNPRSLIPEFEFLDCMLEKVGGGYVYHCNRDFRGKPSAIWEDLRLQAANAKAIWPHSQAAMPETHSGMPGRSTAKHLYLAELERRAKTREMLGTLSEEANALLDWLKNEYPKLNSGTFRTVRNNIRTRYRQLCSESPSSACMK